MNAREIFSAYAAEQRQRAIDGYVREDLGFLVRHTATRAGLDGWVFFAQLPVGREDAIIDQQIEHFAAAGQAFEWKVYTSDTPADLQARLASRGFVTGTIEGFLVRPVGDASIDLTLPPGVELHPVVDAAGVEAVVAVQEKVWRESKASLRAEMLRRLGAPIDERVTLYATSAGQPVGTAWAVFPKKSMFAELYGGSILPEFRSQGIYTALLNRRAEEACRRGYGYLAVDAMPMSRPILLRKGFEFISETWPMKWSPV